MEYLNQPTGPTTDALQDQTDLPNPIDTKGPSEEKPEAKPEPNLSRSEAVKKAVDDALKGSEEKPEKPKSEVKTEEEKPAKERADDGKFKAKSEPEKAADPLIDTPKEPDQPKRPTAHREAPARFDDAAKGEWESVPEGTRGAIHRAIKEMESGIEKHRQYSERYEKTFREFDALAHQHNVDPKAALQAYVKLDQTLRTDLVRGLEEVVAAQGIRGPNGQPVTLRDVAAHILGQTPDQTASRQASENQQLRQQLAQLQQQIGGVSQHIQTQQQQTAHQAAVNEWETFASENEHAKALEQDIAEFLSSFKFGDNVTPREKLERAYRYALSQNPETAAHTSTPVAPLAQTQEAQPKEPNPNGLKSIKGAPSGESRTAPPRKVSRDDAIKSAMRKYGIQ